MAEEVHWARVRAAVAAVALRKGGRRWQPCAARVQAVRVAGGGGTIGIETRGNFWAQDGNDTPAKSVKACRGRILRAFAV